MSTISLRLPNSIHQALRRLAKQDSVSINQLIATAATEKVSALMTADYLTQRARRGHRKNFDAVMDKIPNVEPAAEDRLRSRRRR